MIGQCGREPVCQAQHQGEANSLRWHLATQQLLHKTSKPSVCAVEGASDTKGKRV